MLKMTRSNYYLCTGLREFRSSIENCFPLSKLIGLVTAVVVSDSAGAIPRFPVPRDVHDAVMNTVTSISINDQLLDVFYSCAVCLRFARFHWVQCLRSAAGY